MVGNRSFAILLGVTLMLVASFVASADDDGDSAGSLRPTEIVADIPDGYNQIFPLQWGGGSLRQLKARLATMGCLANTIWVHDDGDWFAYNQYDIPNTALVREFIDRYELHVPAGVLYADCFNICTFTWSGPHADRECASAWEHWSSGRSSGNLSPPVIEQCNTDFDPRVAKEFFHRVAVVPGTCIVRGPNFYGPDGLAVLGHLGGGGGSHPAHILVAEGLWPARALYVEVHELCHIQQHVERIQPTRPLRDQGGRGIPRTLEWWGTEAGKALLDLVPLEGGGRRVEEDGSIFLIPWTVPDDSRWAEFYHTYPDEVGAELCAIWFLREIGESRAWRSYDPDLDRYLTPEIIDWLETYIVLPDISD